MDFVYPKWLDKIFPITNFVFSHDGHFGLEGGGGGRRGVAPLLRRTSPCICLCVSRCEITFLPINAGLELHCVIKLFGHILS